MGQPAIACIVSSKAGNRGAPCGARAQRQTDLASQRPIATATEQSFKQPPDAACIATLKARLFFGVKFLEQKSSKPQTDFVRPANEDGITLEQLSSAKSPNTVRGQACPIEYGFWNIRRAIAFSILGTLAGTFALRFQAHGAFQIFYASSKGLVSS
jgi:hypothetical protein